MPEPGALIGKLALGDGEGLRPGVGKTVAKIEKALGFLENRLGEMKAGEKTVSRKMPMADAAREAKMKTTALTRFLTPWNLKRHRSLPDSLGKRVKSLRNEYGKYFVECLEKSARYYEDYLAGMKAGERKAVSRMPVSDAAKAGNIELGTLNAYFAQDRADLRKNLPEGLKNRIESLMGTYEKHFNECLEKSVKFYEDYLAGMKAGKQKASSYMPVSDAASAGNIELGTLQNYFAPSNAGLRKNLPDGLRKRIGDLMGAYEGHFDECLGKSVKFYEEYLGEMKAGKRKANPRMPTSEAAEAGNIESGTLTDYFVPSKAEQRKNLPDGLRKRIEKLMGAYEKHFHECLEKSVKFYEDYLAGMKAGKRKAVSVMPVSDAAIAGNIEWGTLENYFRPSNAKRRENLPKALRNRIESLMGAHERHFNECLGKFVGWLENDLREIKAGRKRAKFTMPISKAAKEGNLKARKFDDFFKPSAGAWRKNLPDGLRMRVERLPAEWRRTYLKCAEKAVEFLEEDVEEMRAGRRAATLLMPISGAAKAANISEPRLVYLFVPSGALRRENVLPAKLKARVERLRVAREEALVQRLKVAAGVAEERLEGAWHRKMHAQVSITEFADAGNIAVHAVREYWKMGRAQLREELPGKLGERIWRISRCSTQRDLAEFAPPEVRARWKVLEKARAKGWNREALALVRYEGPVSQLRSALEVAHVFFNDDLRPEILRNTLAGNLKDERSQLSAPTRQEMDAMVEWTAKYGGCGYEKFKETRPIGRLRYLLEDARAYDPEFLLTPDHKESLMRIAGR